MDIRSKFLLDPWSWADRELTEHEFLSLIDEPQADYAIEPPESAFSKYIAAKEINARRGAVEAGNGFEVLHCVRMCGTAGLPLPVWLVFEFNRRFDAVKEFRAKKNSWDDDLAFGRPHPKSTHMTTQRKNEAGRMQMWWAVARAVRKGESIDGEAFERLGRPFGFGKTKADELYREAVEILGNDPIEHRRMEKATPRGKASANLRKTSGMKRPKT